MSGKNIHKAEQGKIRKGIAYTGAFLFVFAWATLGHGETLDFERPEEYFHSNLPSSISFEEESRGICERQCLSEEYVLAKRTRKKSSVRKISNSSKNRPRYELGADYFLNIFSDTKYIFLSPLRWKSKDWLKASLVLGTTGVLFAVDDEIQDFIQDERTENTDDISDILEPFGNGGYTFPSLVAYYLYGHYFENTKAERTALLAVESFAVTGIFTFALKFSTGRVRPKSAQDSGEWNGPNFDDVSFPSGHTSSAFAIATVFAHEYKNNPWVPPIAYGLATLTGLSRLNDNKHWASDVFLGGALGYFISKTLIKLHSNKKGRHYTIYPRISQKEVGLDFAMRF